MDFMGRVSAASFGMVAEANDKTVNGTNRARRFFPQADA